MIFAFWSFVWSCTVFSVFLSSQNTSFLQEGEGAAATHFTGITTRRPLETKETSQHPGQDSSQATGKATSQDPGQDPGQNAGPDPGQATSQDHDSIANEQISDTSTPGQASGE